VAKNDDLAQALASAVAPVFRQEIQHVRCGGTYLAHSPSEIVADDENCPVCRRVIAIKAATLGQSIVATPGTPLAEELGLVVLAGTPGPAKGTEIPVNIEA
jgi:hypothetical protein